MTFCNPFLNFSLFSGFALGNYLGNRLSNAIWGKPCQGYISNPFIYSAAVPFMPVYQQPSLYLENMDFIPQAPVFNFSGNYGNFDTFSYSGSYSNYGGYNNFNSFGNWAFGSPGNTNNSNGTKGKNITPLDDITFKYANMSRAEALTAAKKDSNLENLEDLANGKKWTLNSASFPNDIPYAKKGTAKLLDKVYEAIDKYNKEHSCNIKLVVTSALGTTSSKHTRKRDKISHYNELNPKLDFGGGLSEQDAKALEKILNDTGLFCHVYRHEGSDNHLDVQFSDEAYKSLSS